MGGPSRIIYPIVRSDRFEVARQRSHMYQLRSVWHLYGGQGSCVHFEEVPLGGCEISRTAACSLEFGSGITAYPADESENRGDASMTTDVY